ncbi:MAG: tetraacyldisaccharide 4'-kinase [bacterium]
MIPKSYRRKIFGALSGTLAPGILRALSWSQTYDVLNEDKLFDLAERRTNFLLAFWHGQMLPVLFYFTRSDYDQSRFYTFISPHRDGEYITRAASGLGINALRTSLRDRRLGALKEALRVVREGNNLAVTPDGPIGPAFQVKEEIVDLSRKLDLPILPVAGLPSRAKFFDSWDHFCLPYPCSTVRVVFGDLIDTAEDGSSTESMTNKLNSRWLVSLSNRPATCLSFLTYPAPDRDQAMIASLFHDFYNGLRDFYFTDNLSPGQRMLRLGLSTLVPLYTSARSIHQAYRSLNRTSVETPVVSIGNISLGGTGKTAFTIWLIEQLGQSKLQLGVLKRGEGDSSGILPKEEPVYELAQDYGDEAALYRYRFPELPVGVGSDRVELARTMDRQFDLDLLLLDDGFQYRQLDRDVDIVLLAPGDLADNWQIPAGPLRESLSSLSRADFVSLKTRNNAADVKRYSSVIGSISRPPEKMTHQYRFQGIYQNQEEVTEDYRNQPVLLISTLARPDALEDFLEENHVQVDHHRSLPDHGSLRSELSGLSEHGDQPILMTEKEAVKLPDEVRGQVGIVQSRLEVDQGDRLLKWLDDL